MIYTEVDKIANIKEFQKGLRNIAIYKKDIPAVPIDGVYSDELREVVKAYQKSRGLEITGTGNKETWDSVASENEEINDIYDTPVPLNAFPFYNFVMKKGDRGESVYILQTVNNVLSNHFSNIQTVEYTGIFDEKLEENIKKIQKSAQIEETGIVDKKTWNTIANLFNSYSKTPPYKQLKTSGGK